MSLRKTIILIFLVGILALLSFLFLRPSEKREEEQETLTPGESEQVTQSLPNDEEAEWVGFQFILDFIASAPPDADPTAQERVFEALTDDAKRTVAKEPLSTSLPAFIGVQDVPDLGASVEDLQRPTDQTAVLIVGLNYSGGRVLKAIHLVIENGQWKVERVEPLESYPPEN